MKPRLSGPITPGRPAPPSAMAPSGLPAAMAPQVAPPGPFTPQFFGPMAQPGLGVLGALGRITQPQPPMYGFSPQPLSAQATSPMGVASLPAPMSGPAGLPPGLGMVSGGMGMATSPINTLLDPRLSPMAQLPTYRI